MTPALRRVVALLAVALGLLVIARLTGATVQGSLWTDRDLVRAWLSRGTLPTLGPELSYGAGARVPGGAVELLLHAPLALTTDVVGVWRFQSLLDALAAAWLARAAHRLGGPLAAAVTAAVWLTAWAVEETQLRLWNPGLLSLFLAVAVERATAAIGARRAGPLLVAGLALGLAGQCHLTGWGLGLALAVVLPFSGVPVAGSALLLLGAALTLTPYLAADAAAGWSNSRLLWDQAVAGDGSGVPPGTNALRNLGAWARAMVPSPAVPSPTWAAPAAALALLGAGGTGLAALAALPLLRTPDPRGRATRALLTTLLLLLGALLVDARAEPWASFGTRYVLVMLPLVALLAGLGVGALPARRAAFVALLQLGGLGLVTARALPPQPPPGSVRTLEARLDAVRRLTGWTLAEVAGRTAVATVGDDGRATLTAFQGIDWWLLQAGETFPGSLTGPCALLPDGRFRDLHLDAGRLRSGALAAMLPEQPGATVVSADLEPPGQVIVIDVGEARCRTTLTNHYLPTAPERLAWDTLAAVPGGSALEPPAPAGTVVALPEPGGLQWAISVPGDGPHAAVLLKLRPSAGDVRVTLHANQLRGKGFNRGFFANTTLLRPRLRFEGPGPVDVPLATGPVGPQGDTPPLEVHAPLPAGTWRLSFAVDLPSGAPWAVPLPGDVVVR